MAWSSFLLLFLCLIFLQTCAGHQALVCPVDKHPTCGFISLPLNSTNFVHINKPYDQPESARYSFVQGIHKFWVLATDEPYLRGSPTRPRTEIRLRVWHIDIQNILHSLIHCLTSLSSFRLQGYDYSSGVWQFQGHVYVPTGTTGVSIVQVFHATHRNTTLMLHVHDGALMYYGKQLIVDEIYGKWFKVNVIHDVGAGMLKVFIDGDLRLTVGDDGGKSHFFKFGVYTQIFSSYFMESRWKGIKILRLAE